MTTSTPPHQSVLTLYSLLALTPPTDSSTLVGRLPAVGATLSAETGPSPVPHNVITCPGCAARVVLLIGWLLCEIKFCKMPGPSPVPVAVQMPKALGLIFTVIALLCWLTVFTRTD